MNSNQISSQTACTRCGECCSKSSPSLQVQDLHLIQNYFIPKSDLYTIRKGEWVRDNVHDRLVMTSKEFIKLKEKEDNQACMHYDDAQKACVIYAHRPSQCVALQCWDPTEFEKVYSGPKLTRSHIVDNHVLLGLMEEHEKRCDYAILENLIKKIETEGDKAVAKVLDILRFDHELRPFISNKLHLDMKEMDLYFGRPLITTIGMYDLEVRQEPDGGFLLTKKAS